MASDLPRWIARAALPGSERLEETVNDRRVDAERMHTHVKFGPIGSVIGRVEGSLSRLSLYGWSSPGEQAKLRWSARLPRSTLKNSSCERHGQ